MPDKFRKGQNVDVPTKLFRGKVADSYVSHVIQVQGDMGATQIVVSDDELRERQKNGKPKIIDTQTSYLVENDRDGSRHWLRPDHLSA